MHPVLIDMITGAEYEWRGRGYCHEDDHDFAASRKEIERDGAWLVEIRTLSPARFLALRHRYAQQQYTVMAA